VRVLFVSCDPLEGAVTRYRCTHLAEALKSVGHTADVATIYDPVIRLDHDIVVLHRICANKEGQALADAVRKSGATLIYGADDLVWEDGPLAHLHLKMLKQADGALVSTNALATFAKEAGAKEIAVLRNIADDSEEPRCPSATLHFQLKNTMVKILYAAGTPTHDLDLLAVIEPLRDCLAKYPNAHLVLMGPVAVPKAIPEERITRIPRLDWQAYLFVVQHCTIVIAPLDKNRFNRGKSEIKWQEAALCAKPVVASQWGGFQEMIRDGDDGFLAANSEEWVEQLERLIKEDDGCYNPLREEIGGRAQDRLRSLREHELIKNTNYFEHLVSMGAKLASSTIFSNPRGFAKGMVKKTLRRLKA
jgi:glycosyltransferase involved in cell wall biosynthesis